LGASLLFRWRKLFGRGGPAAAEPDEEVIDASDLRKLETRIHKLERRAGPKTLKAES
jgi:hypothetical protein